MSYFTVTMRRRVIEHRIVTVYAHSAEKARTRALAIARDAILAEDYEDAAEWCDSTPGRTVVMEIRPKRVPW